MDESIVAKARATVGADSMLMVDAGGSDAFWQNGYKWALRTAQMLQNYDVAWFEEPLKADALDDYVLLRRSSQSEDGSSALYPLSSDLCLLTSVLKILS